MEGKTERPAKTVKTIFRLITACIVCWSFFGFAHAADAATMYLAPSEKSVSVGETFSVGIYVSSPDQAMNAVSGVINVPSDKLEIVGLSKGGSIINLWVQEPSYSAGAGRANFEGVVLNPGYTGSAGNVITLTFRAKAPGSAIVSFSSAALLANDGLGTNILKGLGSATYVIGGEAPPPEEPPEEPREEPREEEPREEPRPGAPVVTSDTHPDSESWYSANDVSLSWSIPRGVTAVRVLASQDAEELPTMTHSPPIDSIELNDLDEGVWYLHVRFRSASGWGPTTHFKFQIDATGPESIEVSEVRREDPTLPTVSFTILAEDAASGIDFYEMELDGRAPIEWRDDGAHLYTTPIMAPGKHTLLVRAFDAAGNAAETSATFFVDALTPPILNVPADLTSGDVLIIKGESGYPGAQVTIWIQRDDRDPESATVTADANGAFTYVMDGRVRGGIYKVWAELADSRGARSEASKTATIGVRARAYAEYLAWLFWPLLLLVLILLFLLWRQRRRYLALKRRRDREEQREDRAVQKKLTALKRDVRTEFKSLESRNNLKKKDLDAAEAKLKGKIDEASILLDEVTGKTRKRR